MKGPAGVMALVLAETAAGGAAFLFLTPLWSELKRGFFYLTGAVVLALAAGAAGAASSGYDRAASSSARLATLLALALAGVTLVWIVLVAARQRQVGRALGFASVACALAMLIAFARTADESAALASFELLAGACFTGAVLDGLLLGHWYLTDRGLPRAPINRMAWILMAAVALEAVAVLVGAAGPSRAGAATANTLNPLLTLAGSSTLIAIGMVACTGLVAVMIHLTLRGTRPAAVQSATGFFYIAVITAFAAEIAAKVRLLP